MRAPTFTLLVRLSVVLGFLGIFPGSMANDQPESLQRRASSAAESNHYWETPERDVSSSTQTDNPYWEFPVADAATQEPNSDASLSTATAIDEDSDRATVTTSAEESAFVKKCVGLLETHASDNEQVSRQDYVDFLADVSQGTLKARTFQDLPLFLSMIFFSASCSHGEDCVTQAPSLVVNRQLAKGERDMNAVLCHQLMRFPFLEVLFPFQFLIQVSSEFSAEDILVAKDKAQIVPNLEFALDSALLKGFNCTYVPGESVVSVSRQPKPRGKRQKLISSGNRQPQPQDDCNYVVDVTIADAADYRKSVVAM